MASILSVKQSEILKSFYLVDVSNLKIGRASTYIAQLLLGKLNPKVRPNLDPMVFVLVTNASKLDIPEKRMITTFFQRYSGYPGGLKHESLKDVMKKNPSKALALVVKGMLPKTKKGRKIFPRLKINNFDVSDDMKKKYVCIDISKIKF